MAKRHTFEGLPITDSEGSLDIIVLPRDVRGSVAQSPSDCAIAKACHRLFHTDVRVHLTRTYLKDGNRWIRFRTPTAARDEIVAFDHKIGFTPGTYTLLPVPQSDRLGRSKTRGKDTGNGPKRKTAKVTAGVRPSAPKR